MAPSAVPAIASREDSELDAAGMAGAVGKAFREIFGYPARATFRAPGRVNLIGEHTDYNDGFVLPMAIDRWVWMAAAPAGCQDRTVRLAALSLDSEVQSFSLDDLQPARDARWTNYVRGVLALLERAGHRLGSLDLVYAGNVPIGAGLSSSAAVEVAVGTAARELYDLELSDLALAQICQQAEHEFVGTRCGLMDQLISVAGKEGNALFIDCRHLTWEAVPIPDSAAIVVCDTGKRRGLATSAYNERRAQCEEGARLLGVGSLRDLDVDSFEVRAKELPTLLRWRCRHVVHENDRTLRAAKVLRQGRLDLFGQLMNQSHASLRDLYEVSCEELDLMAALAQSQPCCWGARMTGAGFGGCVVALVERDEQASFAETMAILYERQTRRTPALYACQPSAGAVSIS